MSSSTGPAASPRVSRASGTISSSAIGCVEHRERAGLQAAHVEQVVHQPVQPVQRLVGGGQQLRPLLRRPLHVGAAQAGHRRLRRRERRPQVVADGASRAVRMRSASASGFAAAAAWASRCCSSAVAACAANAPRMRRSSAASGRPRTASASRSVIGTSVSASAGRCGGSGPTVATGVQPRPGPAALGLRAFEQRDRRQRRTTPAPAPAARAAPLRRAGRCRRASQASVTRRRHARPARYGARPARRPS